MKTNTAVYFFLIKMTCEFHHFTIKHLQIMLFLIWNSVLHIDLNKYKR